MNNLIINEKVVRIETDVFFRAMELSFVGNLYITNLLPNDYLVKKGNSKIIILKMGIIVNTVKSAPIHQNYPQYKIKLK